MRLTKRQTSALLSLVVFLVFAIYTAYSQGTSLTSVLFPSPTPSPKQSPSEAVLDSQTSPETAIVTRVIDGDTIEINGEITVRYIGIDTPETVDPRRSVQCFGKEASAKNSELVLNKTVRLEKDVSDTDRYGRLLRYVYIDDVMVNEVLVLEGFAQSSAYPPDVKHQERLDSAEETARNAGRGLWGSCEEEG